MADVNSLIALGMPWAVAKHVVTLTPDADVLMAYGVPRLQAVEIAATPAAGSTVKRLMATGIPALLAQETYAVLNP